MKTIISGIIFCFIISCNSADTSTTNNQSNSVSTVQESTSELIWKFVQSGETEFGAPITKTILVFGAKELVVDEQLTESCSEVLQSEYKTGGIPENAACAFRSWWAGGGTLTYALFKNSKIEVYRTYLDEGQTEEDKGPAWTKIKEFAGN